MAQVSREELPSLLKRVAFQQVAGFDSVGSVNNGRYEARSELVPANEPRGGGGAAGVSGLVALDVPDHEIEVTQNRLPAANDQGSCSISVSLPASPSGLHVLQTKQVEAVPRPAKSSPTAADASLKQARQGKFHSQPMPAAMASGKIPDPADKNRRVYDSFKTWSGGLERQLSNLRGRPQEPVDVEANDSHAAEAEALPAVGRYFDALDGPELDTLRVSEVSVLPKDKKWPFLLRFPVSSFGMCLGVGSQAILWKTLATATPTGFLRVSLIVNFVLWCIALALTAAVSLIYLSKIVFYFEAVKREYDHPVRVNFFFAPWIACLFLAQGAPPSVAKAPHPALWYALMAPIFCLELKIYGQWMSGGQRRLSKVANPSNHLSIVGNFVGALVGATAGLREGPIFFYAVGLSHYIVLFVTLYQRLPTNKTLPKELHPVFFLFVAVPSVASMAWAKIEGDFGYGPRIVYFIALFLYISLAVRLNFFRGFRFSLAWWAYTFPTTAFSLATIKYSTAVTNLFTQAMCVGFSAISTFTVAAVFITTIVHAFVLHDLFPNDISIAITPKRAKFSKFIAHLRSMSSDTKELEAASTKKHGSEI